MQVVGFYGTKSVSYQEALAAIFIEGWIFIAISILGIRQKLIGLLPRYSTKTLDCLHVRVDGQLMLSLLAVRSRKSQSSHVW